MAGAAVVSLHGVTKRYGRRSGASVLSGVTLAVDPGALVVVGGANGAGKSTLLRIAAGLARPSGGQVIRRHRTRSYTPASNPVCPRCRPGGTCTTWAGSTAWRPRRWSRASPSCATCWTCGLGPTPR